VKDLGLVFTGLYREKFSDARLDRATLQERAERIIDDIRNQMEVQLANVAAEALDAIHESTGDVEDTINKLLNDPDLLTEFQNKAVASIRALQHVPARTLARLIDRFPEYLLDGRVFKMPYMGISISDDKATSRARLEAKKRVLSYLEDALLLASGAMNSASKDELGRAAYSLSFIERMMVV
jgi:hypothetical protein